MTKYKYNRLNQLTEVTKPNKTTEKYFYDTVGNRIRKENWVCSTFIDASDYQYDLQNRLTNINIQGIQMPCKKPQNQSITMEYDQRGNLIKITNGNRVLNQYTFDTDNRLSEATNVLGIKTNFNYDGAGRRTKMQITLPKPPKCFQPGLSSLFNSKNQANEKDISSWLYNGKDHKVEYNYVLDITEPYENVLMIYGQGIDTQRYTYGLDVLSLDTWNKSLSTWNQNCAKAITAKKADRSYYLQDELGSPIRIIGEAGNTKARYSYDAFGRPIIPVNLISRSKTRGNIYSYTGYQYDLSTGLMYAQARYYMPEVGRFISADAYKGTVTDPQSLNLYVYCRNNPVNAVDLSGFESIVVSGGYAGYEAFRYMFIETGINAIKGLQNNYPDEGISWVISNAGYSDKDIKHFNKTANSLGVNLIIMNDKQQLLDYINTKSGTIEDRLSDPITNFAVLSHGYTEELALAHGHDNLSSLINITLGDINKLDSSAFNNVTTWFGSCNTGTQTSIGTSFAQEWVNKTGGYATAVVGGKTNYQNINIWQNKIFLERLFGRISRLRTGYSQSGSRNLPNVGMSPAYWHTFTPN